MRTSFALTCCLLISSCSAFTIDADEVRSLLAETNQSIAQTLVIVEQLAAEDPSKQPLADALANLSLTLNKAEQIIEKGATGSDTLTRVMELALFLLGGGGGGYAIARARKKASSAT